MDIRILISLVCLISAAAAADVNAGFGFPLHKARTVATQLNDFDYIVVGGGATGCAIAATLSEKFRVLLLERGGSPYSNALMMREENFFLGFTDDGAQGFVSTDGVANARGRVLGGGSSINAGFWDRASDAELELIGISKADANASYTWAENVIVSLPTLGPFQKAFHKGLVEVGVKPDLGATYEHSVGTKVGGTLFDAQGQRRPSSNLIAAYASRENLQVLLHAQVNKILFEEGPKAIGVQFVDNIGTTHYAYLKKSSKSEVIISASAIGTPHLLMVSGIGPKEHLQKFNIPVLVDLPVGKNIADNPATRVDIPSMSPVETALVKVAGITSFDSYIESLSGVQFLPGSVIFQKVAGPKSAGEVLLNEQSAADISENPIVTFNYYNNTDDLKACIGGLNVMENLLLSKTMTPFVNGMQALPSGGMIGFPNRRLVPQEITDLALATYCKQNVGTMWHYHGSCRVGQVVDNDYKVLNTAGLRIVDASVFDFCPGTNPQATFVMMGRHMGVKISRERETLVA